MAGRRGRKKDTKNWDGARKLFGDLFRKEPAEDLEYSDFETVLKKAFVLLNFRQIFVTIQHYGLHGGERASYEEIGEFIGRSAENVRQHGEKALRELRRPSSGLQRYVEPDKKLYELAVVFGQDRGEWEAGHFFEAASESEAHALFEETLRDKDPYAKIFTHSIQEIED